MGKVLIAVLLLVGSCISLWYFHVNEMPNPDGSSFLIMAKSLCHGHLPTNFQRGPLYGLILYPVSLVLPGPHPEWDAAILVTAIMYPIALVLIYLVASTLLASQWSGLWIALLAGCNPWMVMQLGDALCEITLTVSILLTVLCVLRESRWAYLCACLAALTRPDVAGLLFGVFLMDAIRGQLRRAIGYSILAGAPLALWLLAMLYTLHRNPAEPHFFNLSNWSLLFDSDGWVVLAQTIVWPLSAIVPVVILFYLLLLWGFWRLRFGFILAFWVPYLVIHQVYLYHVPRMFVPTVWLVLIALWKGLADAFKLAPKIAAGALVGTTAASLLLLGSETMASEACRHSEFKALVEWYSENARPGEKLACSMARTMVDYEPKYKDVFLGLSDIPGADPNDFYRQCKVMGVTFVCYDSYLGDRPQELYYRIHRFSNIADLVSPQDTEQYKFVVQLCHPTYADRFVNVFRVR